MKKESWEHEVEALLARVRPAALTAEEMKALEAAEPLGAAVEEVKVISGPWKGLLKRMTMVAAAAMLAVWLSPRDGRRGAEPVAGKVPENERLALTSKEHLLKVDDLGVMNAGDEGVVRLLRTTWVDEIVVGEGDEQRTEARLRQEVVPVAVTIY